MTEQQLYTALIQIARNHKKIELTKSSNLGKIDLEYELRNLENFENLKPVSLLKILNSIKSNHFIADLKLRNQLDNELLQLINKLIDSLVNNNNEEIKKYFESCTQTAKELKNYVKKVIELDPKIKWNERYEELLSLMLEASGRIMKMVNNKDNSFTMKGFLFRSFNGKSPQADIWWSLDNDSLELKVISLKIEEYIEKASTFE